MAFAGADLVRAAPLARAVNARHTATTITYVLTRNIMIVIIVSESGASVKAGSQANYRYIARRKAPCLHRKRLALVLPSRRLGVAYFAPGNICELAGTFCPPPTEPCEADGFADPTGAGAPALPSDSVYAPD